MYTYQPGKGAIRRNPVGGFRALRSALNPRRQRPQARVLLVDRGSRCYQDCAVLPGMPVLCETDVLVSCSQML
jgi:hypothetical protein